jgi:tRNA dimethylallyltransferase
MGELSLQKLIENHLKSTLDKLPLIVILGPTASGKTALSIALAKKMNAEIISADSRQVYKYMNIGTAKISEIEAQGVTHYLLDVVNPDQPFNLAEYKKLAEVAIEKIHKKNKLPFLVGGTGLYISAITENYHLPTAPPLPELRKKLEKIAQEQGLLAVYELLQKRDPEAAKKIHPQNLRYVIRALEIIETQNTPIIDLKDPSPYHTLFIGIEWPRELLYERIDRRVDQQIQRGFLDEVKSLLAQGYDENLPSLQTLGYSELMQFLKQEISLEDALALIKQHTRNYAKRQLTWFRRYKNVHWLPGRKLGEIIEALSLNT